MVVHTGIKYMCDDAREKVLQFVALLDNAGLNPKIGWTYRPQEIQDRYWKKSLELIADGHAPVTKTDHSWHSAGRAADIDISPATLDNIKTFLSLAQSVGLKTMYDSANIQTRKVNGKDVPYLWDWHHVEFRAGKTWAEAMKEYDQLQLAPPALEASFLNVKGPAGLALLGSSIIGVLGQ